MRSASAIQTKLIGVTIPLLQVSKNGSLRMRCSRVEATPNTSLANFGKQSFHRVQPTPTGRREVNVVPSVASQPSSHFPDLVSAIVAPSPGERPNLGDYWRRFRRGNAGTPGAVPPVTTADSNATGHWPHPRSQQRPNSVRFVFVRLACAAPLGPRAKSPGYG